MAPESARMALSLSAPLRLLWPSEARIDPSRLIFGNRRLIAMSHYDPWVLPRALDFLTRTR